VLYRFGPFVVDRSSYRALRGDTPLDLTPKLLDLLLYLVEHAGTLVTKEALLDALWPDANVTDNALAQAMSELREALGDPAASPTFIKTIARRGYRFIAPVETSGAGIAAMAAAGGAAESPHPPDEPETDARTIAVMDFVNVSADAESAWLSAGIAETVTGDLRALEHFRVIDRWRVMEAARRTDGSLLHIAHHLRARLMVVGSYQRNRARVRITARVVDVISGEAVADAKVDGPIDTIFALPDTESDVEHFLARVGRGSRTASARATDQPIQEHWDRIASTLQAGRTPTSPALNRFWQSLPGLLQSAATPVELPETRKRLDCLEKELVAAHAESASLQAHIQEVKASISWKLTAPMRFIGRHLLKITSAIRLENTRRSARRRTALPAARPDARRSSNIGRRD
jgi:DNA-binding winged helix-turn-helix (wHTH) protein